MASIARTLGGPAKVRTCLAEVLSKIWRKQIAGDFLESLWKSIPKRVAAVIEAKGWYTKY